MEAIKAEFAYLWRRVFSRSINYHGVVVPLGATPEIGRISHMLLRNTYERAEIDAVCEWINPADRVVEIGSSLGVVSVAIAKRLMKSDQLVCYEGNIGVKPSFEAIVKANGCEINVVYKLIGGSAGNVPFFVDDLIISSSVVDRGRRGRRDIVEQRAFSDLCEEFRPTVIVMDVEGAETQILLDPLPAPVSLVVIELHPHIVGDQAISDLIGSLLQQGFVVSLSQLSSYVHVFVRGDRFVSHQG